MTNDDFTPAEMRDLLAAEYALGLLEGDELVRAREMAETDGEFAALVASWHGKLIGLTDEIATVEPPRGSAHSSASGWRRRRPTRAGS